MRGNLTEPRSRRYCPDLYALSHPSVASMVPPYVAALQGFEIEGRCLCQQEVHRRKTLP